MPSTSSISLRPFASTSSTITDVIFLYHTQITLSTSFIDDLNTPLSPFPPFHPFSRTSQYTSRLPWTCRRPQKPAITLSRPDPSKYRLSRCPMAFGRYPSPPPSQVIPQQKSVPRTGLLFPLPSSTRRFPSTNISRWRGCSAMDFHPRTTGTLPRSSPIRIHFIDYEFSPRAPPRSQSRCRPESAGISSLQHVDVSAPSQCVHNLIAHPPSRRDGFGLLFKKGMLILVLSSLASLD